MRADPTPILQPDPLELATDQVIEACDGDVRAAVRALIIAKVYWRLTMTSTQRRRKDTLGSD